MVLYPEAYGTKMTTLDGMIAKHGDKMHPEFRRRFFAYIESKDGLLGVGGGFRVTQPNKAGFAPPGKSFHQNQKFKSGITAYSAVDLVRLRPGGGVHMSPSWDDCADAPEWAAHVYQRRTVAYSMYRNERLPELGVRWPKRPTSGGSTERTTTRSRHVSTDPADPQQRHPSFGTSANPGKTHTFALSPVIPADAVAVALNVTVISPTKSGYLVVWPSGPTPPTSTVNFAPGEIISSSAIIGVKNGNFNIEIVGSSAHVIVDVTGYWTSLADSGDSNSDRLISAVIAGNLSIVVSVVVALMRLS
jgi:hypothetical protein